MFSLRERARYSFDNLLAKGTFALVIALAVVSGVTLVVLGGIVVVAGIAPEGSSDRFSFGEAIWFAFTREIDAGNIAGDNGGLRFVMIFATFSGIFILSTFIGVLSNGLEARIEELRKGRSRVVEHDHTVVLGWGEQIFAVISELVEANASRRGGRGACIVVLGDKDKAEMDDAIRDKIGDPRGTRIVCRHGKAIESGDLRIAGIDTARAIIIVAPERDGSRSDDPDVDVIKTLLAITNNKERKKGRYHIVAEVRDPRNFEVAEMVGKDEVELVLVGDLVARIMAQTCRQSGLSVVYQELLDFAGDEIYFRDEPGLAGKTYGEALLAYEDCSVMGVRPRTGIPILNPPPDTPVNAGDKLIVIAEDDAKIKMTTVKEPDLSLVQLSDDASKKPEKTLVLGWNWRAPHVINELDSYVLPGSSVHVVADFLDAEEVLKEECASLKRQTLSFQHGDTSDRRTLDSLKVDNFDHIIVLCYSDVLDAQKADAATLITLLHLRDIADKTKKRVSIVSEMLDMNNRTLAEVTQADDFIVSDRLVSLMMTQISENKELNIVFRDLFSPEGVEVYLKPASSYVKLGVAMSYSTVVAAAAQRSESAIGYKLAAQANDAEKAYGVAVNPDKSAPVTFGPNDKIIVLSEQ